MIPLILLLAAITGLMGCAPTQSLDTHAWAVQQDSILSHPRSQADCKPLKPFKELYDVQVKIQPDNLTYRDDIIRSACESRNGDSARAAALFGRTIGDIEIQSRNGYWPEFYSYWKYVTTATDWYEYRAGWIDSVDTAYSRLVGPDGQIPLPETRIGPPLPVPVQQWFTDESYFVRRWGNSYLLIDIDTTAHPVRNFHSKPSFGMYAYYRDGKWVHRIPAYEGYKPTEPLTEKEDLLLPWEVYGWRIHDKPRKVVLKSFDRVVLEYGEDTIDFQIGDSVTVRYGRGK